MATLQKLGKEERCPLDLSQMGIGRAPDNEIVVEDDTVSGYHSLITVRPSEQDDSVNEYIIEDLESTNKTYVNNKEIKTHLLKNGDIIRVGETRLKFSTEKYQSPPKTDFIKTTKLTTKKVSSFLFTK
ncbi:MAG: FHA domain-containing protein [Gammaproteobacteria bacterium]|nr:FHA domain-containing protein [Gammaproteobacteria bacterium]